MKKKSSKKGLRKGSFEAKMYAKGVRRGKHVAKAKAQRVQRGLSKSKNKQQSIGAYKVGKSIDRSLGVKRGNYRRGRKSWKNKI